jgi:hypothetical protein
MRAKRMVFLCPDVGGSSSETVATAVADAVTESFKTVVDDSGDGKGKKESSKATEDEKAEYFIRRVTESVTKSIADLLKPPTPEKKEEESEESDDGKEDKPRKRRAPTPAPTKKGGGFGSLKLW